MRPSSGSGPVGSPHGSRSVRPECVQGVQCSASLSSLILEACEAGSLQLHIANGKSKHGEFSNLHTGSGGAEDREAWWAPVHRVAKSRAQLRD